MFCRSRHPPNSVWRLFHIAGLLVGAAVLQGASSLRYSTGNGRTVPTDTDQLDHQVPQQDDLHAVINQHASLQLHRRLSSSNGQFGSIRARESPGLVMLGGIFATLAFCGVGFLFWFRSSSKLQSDQLTDATAGSGKVLCAHPSAPGRSDSQSSTARGSSLKRLLCGWCSSTTTTSSHPQERPPTAVQNTEQSAGTYQSTATPATAS